jgi:hypothetical protein
MDERRNAHHFSRIMKSVPVARDYQTLVLFHSFLQPGTMTILCIPNDFQRNTWTDAMSLRSNGREPLTWDPSRGSADKTHVHAAVGRAEQMFEKNLNRQVLVPDEILHIEAALRHIC